MSDEYPEFDLLAAFKQRFGFGESPVDTTPDTKVLSSAQYVADNAIDVFIDRAGMQAAAAQLLAHIREKPFSTAAWSEHELHPRVSELGMEATVEFIFTMDLLNFSFWSESEDPKRRFCVAYKDRQWTGYWSLIAAMRRALEDDVPFTSPDFWQCEEECNDELLRRVFRSETDEEMPLLTERLECLREAGAVLYKRFDCSFLNCIKKADKSAARLVNLLADNFPCFRDETRWEGEKVRFYKRAQILVADIWACFQGEGPGEFHDIETITAFADYRIPQMLSSLGCLSFSPPLDNRIRQRQQIESGHSWEVQLRGCSVWAVELLIREIKAQTAVADAGNAEHVKSVCVILLDYHLYDSAKALEAAGQETTPHHRTRSIWY